MGFFCSQLSNLPFDTPYTVGFLLGLPDAFYKLGFLHHDLDLHLERVPHDVIELFIPQVMARAAAFVLFAAGALIIDVPLSLIAGRPAHQPTATVPTVEKACKQGHRFGIVRPAGFGFQDPLHQFKLLCRNDCFMSIVNNRPVPHRHIHFLFGAIIQSPGLSLYQFPGIDLIVQDAVHCLGRPRRLIALAEMQAQLCTALQLSRGWGWHFLCIQTVCDALIIHTADLPAENTLHILRCQFIYNQLGVIGRVFLVSIGCKTSHKIAVLPFDCKLALDFDGNIPAVGIIEQIPHRDHDGITGLPRRLAVIVVRHCNQPDPHDRENPFQIASHFNIVSPEAGQIFHQNAVDGPLFQFLEQILERRAFKVRAGVAIVHKLIHDTQFRVVCGIGFQQCALVCNAVALCFIAILTG